MIDDAKEKHDILHDYDLDDILKFPQALLGGSLS